MRRLGDNQAVRLVHRQTQGCIHAERTYWPALVPLPSMFQELQRIFDLMQSGKDQLTDEEKVSGLTHVIVSVGHRGHSLRGTQLLKIPVCVHPQCMIFIRASLNLGRLHFYVGSLAVSSRFIPPHAPSCLVIHPCDKRLLTPSRSYR